MKEKYEYGPWLVEFSPEDGARLDRISFNNYDLLTVEPESFHKPDSDYGKYETRPVYGYDDCFPSVEKSYFPGREWEIPDHGELCWLNWKFTRSLDKLSFSTRSKVLPVEFKREMIFTESGITWKFEVLNESSEKIPFQHVMHPLMKLTEISSIQFPGFQSVYNKTTDESINLKNPGELQEYLLKQPSGTANMLFLRNTKKGKMSWVYKNGLLLKIEFPKKYFPSIGIWWNNNGYPNEDGIKRDECAFEPIPGNTSKLSETFSEGKCLTVSPEQSFNWKITWELIK
jgi:hypothetical protein